MTDFTLVNPGLVNNAGTADALFLKVFSGEVLTAFMNATVFDSSSASVRSRLASRRRSRPLAASRPPT
jgi:hypothetical protein